LSRNCNQNFKKDSRYLNFNRFNLESGNQIKTFYINRLNELSWDSTFDYCHKFGMNLATFNSYREADYFKRLTIKHVWVGISDKRKEGYFVRATDGKIVNKAYIPWGYDEPNNADGNEDCVLLQSNGFNDADCRNSMSFICERITEKAEVKLIPTTYPWTTTASLRYEKDITTQRLTTSSPFQEPTVATATATYPEITISPSQWQIMQTFFKGTSNSQTKEPQATCKFFISHDSFIICT
jgi:hypothetical protein